MNSATERPVRVVNAWFTYSTWGSRPATTRKITSVERSARARKRSSLRLSAEVASTRSVTSLTTASVQTSPSSSIGAV